MPDRPDEPRVGPDTRAATVAPVRVDAAAETARASAVGTPSRGETAPMTGAPGAVPVRRRDAVVFEPGTVVAGRYELREHLGAGGMGTVHAARDRLLEMPVALKFVRPQMADDPGEQSRLWREVRLAQAITHPNIVRTYTLERHERHLFIVMELLEGSSLAERLRGGGLPVDEALRIVRDVLTGLAAMHAKNIVHRDIKPQNTWIGTDGRVVLMDFGIARAQAAPPPPSESAADSGVGTALAGTPGYIAPEVLAGASATTASDLYAVGVLLHQMLTGRLPRVRGSAGATRTASPTTGTGDAAIDAPAIDLSSVPAPIVGVLERLLADDPRRRYPSAEATSQAIAALTSGAARRSRRAIAVGAVGAVGAVVASALVWIAWPRAEAIAPAVAPIVERAVTMRHAVPPPLAPGPVPPPEVAPPPAPAPQVVPAAPKRRPRPVADHGRSSPAPAVIPAVPAVPAPSSLDEAAQDRERLFDLKKKTP